MPTRTEQHRRQARDVEKAIGRADLAAEFLRRNPTYRAEYAGMQQCIGRGEDTKANAEAVFARRWGLSFRHAA